MRINNIRSFSSFAICNALLLVDVSSWLEVQLDEASIDMEVGVDTDFGFSSAEADISFASAGLRTTFVLLINWAAFASVSVLPFSTDFSDG